MFYMQNGEVFLGVAVAIGAFTIFNLYYVHPDIVASLNNNTERVDYFQKGQNTSAKKINRTALHSYFQPLFKKQFWTASETKADKVRILQGTTSTDKNTRDKASAKVAKHKVRAGTGVVGRSNRLYEYYG